MKLTYLLDGETLRLDFNNWWRAYLYMNGLALLYPPILHLTRVYALVERSRLSHTEHGHVLISVMLLQACPDFPATRTV